jgi:transketolase C-terminal domain/subunit
VPSNKKEMKEAIEIAIEYNGPVYIRVARDVIPVVGYSLDLWMKTTSNRSL